MKKLFGASAILLACFLCALRRLRAKKERIRLLRSLGTSLLELRGELAERQRGLREVFSVLSQKNEGDAVGCFYASLCSELDGLGERSFAEIWSRTAESCFASKGDKLRDALGPLGSCLGGSELDRQCAALETAARRLAEEERAEKEALRAERKLSFGLALSAGAFLVIILM